MLNLFYREDGLSLSSPMSAQSINERIFKTYIT
nr:MAG TPA: hypothetical protein [Bacteriophage sp.]